MADETETPAPDVATQPVELPPGSLVAPGSMGDGSQEGDPGDWQPPQVDEFGFAIDGHGLPINLRRRALVLADRASDFEDGDPAGSVSAEAVEAAKQQLADYDASYPSLSGMSKAKLQDQAEAEGVAVAEDAKADEIRDAIQTARPARI